MQKETISTHLHVIQPVFVFGFHAFLRICSFFPEPLPPSPFTLEFFLTVVRSFCPILAARALGFLG